MTPVEVIRNYLQWQHAIHEGVSGEEAHRALVAAGVPKPTLAEALGAVALLDSDSDFRADRVIVLEADNGWKRQIEASEALPNFTETIELAEHKLTISVLAADDVYA